MMATKKDDTHCFFNNYQVLMSITVREIGIKEPCYRKNKTQSEKILFRE